jgi:hypothetical protein
LVDESLKIEKKHHSGDCEAARDALENARVDVV